MNEKAFFDQNEVYYKLNEENWGDYGLLKSDLIFRVRASNDILTFNHFKFEDIRSASSVHLWTKTVCYYCLRLAQQMQHTQQNATTPTAIPTAAGPSILTPPLQPSDVLVLQVVVWALAVERHMASAIRTNSKYMIWTCCFINSIIYYKEL